MKLKTMALCMVVICLGAQSAPPAAPAEQGQAEGVLKERAKRFYDLLAAGKARAGEEFVCEASKDEYYTARKTKPQGADVSQVQIGADGKTARVVTMLEDEVMLPMGGLRKQRMSTPSDWKLENGQWCYDLKPDPQNNAAEPAKAPAAGAMVPPIPGQPPAGVQLGDLPRLMNAVTVSKQQFKIPGNVGGEDEVDVTNGLNGPVKLVFGCRKIPGLECKSDKSFIGHGQQARLTVGFKFSGARLPGDLKAVLWVEPFHNLMLFPILAH